MDDKKEIDRLRAVLQEVIAMTKTECSKESIAAYIKEALTHGRR